jgi:hypothetical protein
MGRNTRAKGFRKVNKNPRRKTLMARNKWIGKEDATKS